MSMDLVKQHAAWQQGEAERPDLRGADLGGAYLRGANLRWAYLRGANLRGADLREADLGGANLGGAYLRRANLRGADLRWVYLREADLGGADLGEADLAGADLREADLREADLGGANLGGADLGDTVLDPAVSVRNRATRPKTARGIVAYRTAKSAHVGSAVYTPGRTYTAPVMSWCPNTNCHPGLYAYTDLDELRRQYPDHDYVRVYYRAGEFLAVDKPGGCVRGPRFRVLEVVT